VLLLREGFLLYVHGASWHGLEAAPRGTAGLAVVLDVWPRRRIALRSTLVQTVQLA
jgi:hypothetical protein